MSLKTLVTFNLLTLFSSLVAGHGVPTDIEAGGKTYPAAPPSWLSQVREALPNQSVWKAGPLGEWGTFVGKDKISHPDIICHVNAQPVPTHTVVNAGEDVKIHFDIWTQTFHNGPILVYLGDCGGPCSSAKKTEISWVKIFEEGMLEDSKSPVDGKYIPGKWATDKFVERGNSSSIKIPENLAQGYYLLRFEMIPLHAANRGEPQFYPYCINLEVKGSGTTKITGGTKGTELYNMDMPGLKANIYIPIGSYQIPGPKLWDGSSSSSSSGGSGSSRSNVNSNVQVSGDGISPSKPVTTATSGSSGSGDGNGKENSSSGSGSVTNGSSDSKTDSNTDSSTSSGSDSTTNGSSGSGSSPGSGSDSGSSTGSDSSSTDSKSNSDSNSGSTNECKPQTQTVTVTATATVYPTYPSGTGAPSGSGSYSGRGARGWKRV
ncbi:MAG: hypothetical protein M1823_006181 [Watsoniomyces obsoletus]|nr:MAG: hypothetical protein M1823_006181 [Watsoniomyces obsoletus]